MTIAVYGDFGKDDIRLKMFRGNSTNQFVFQNTLKDAGYDCKLFFVTEQDLAEAGVEVVK